MPAYVTAIYRYPVKGLPAEPLPSTPVEPGRTLPLDRAWAIENGRGRFDASSPRHVPKINFLMLMRDERLAKLETHFDEASQTLTVLRAGKSIAKGDLTTPSGRLVIEQFMSAFMAGALRGAPKIVAAADGMSFTDCSEPYVHIINLASLRELESKIGRAVDPLRFRPNVVIDGAAAWAEFGWVGREIAVGSVHLAIRARTDRCAATNVEPRTGVRDLDIPAVLSRTWGHIDFGVYAEVLTAGKLTVGDAVETLASPIAVA